MSKTNQWVEVEVWLPGRGALRTLVPGENWEEARTYAERKYRGCLVLLPGQVKKPELARSKNGADKDARAMLKRRQQESRS